MRCMCDAKSLMLWEKEMFTACIMIFTLSTIRLLPLSPSKSPPYHLHSSSFPDEIKNIEKKWNQCL